MTRDDIIRLMLEAEPEMIINIEKHEEGMQGFTGEDPKLLQFWPFKTYVKFAALVAAEKDKEIERLRADAKRLDWCISVLHSQNEKDSYLVTDTGCGCCGDGRHFDSSISGRDAIDAAMQGKGEQEQPR